MAYVRDRYGVPAKRGARVIADGKPGTIVAARDGHLRILLDGERRTGSWHPLWHMDYGDGIDHGARYDARVEAFNAALRRHSSPEPDFIAPAPPASVNGPRVPAPRGARATDLESTDA